MKKTFSLLLLVIASLSVFSQSNYVINGKIIDAVSKLPLYGASVFAENTTLGTASNNDGVFTLHLPNGGYNLVVTFTGYQTETKRITTADAGGSILIEVKQKEKSLDDVVVKATYEVPNGWEKYGDFFLDNFIGKTANAKESVIKNKEVLKFYYYKRKNRLKVLANEPLEIENNALGYTVKYTLDSFTHEYNTQVSLYSGYPLFQELIPANPEQENRWKANRLIAYKGSILHFMRSMYRKKLNEEGFEIQFLVRNNDKETAFTLKNFYTAMNYNMDYSTNIVDILPNQKEVAILFKDEAPSKLFLDANQDASSKFQLSVVSFLPNESIDIEQNGYYYEQNDITITGYWAWEKVADMLPYNFKDGNEPMETIAVTEKKPDPVTEQPVYSNSDPLTSVTWKMDESRIIDGTNMFYYKREGKENSIDLDRDFYKFNTDNTGTYFSNDQEYKLTWTYIDAEKTKMKIVVLYPTPLVVNLENIVLTPSSFKYTRVQKVNGVNFMAIETRTVK
ncbi:MAG TPA: carboxypeptidase-like regulatory domain-containing protein [Ferruginibacter sp.]|nr:carboxypeptidase-like regulatory domain-containing protein [Ferruginibacter sp.]